MADKWDAFMKTLDGLAIPERRIAELKLAILAIKCASILSEDDRLLAAEYFVEGAKKGVAELRERQSQKTI